jgi:hypothetical protein
MSRTGWLLTTTPISAQSLTEVNITSPTDGQALVYNAATSKWINGTASSSGTVTSSETSFTSATSAFTVTTAAVLGRNIILNYTGVALILVNVNMPTASSLISTLGLTANDMSWDFSFITGTWSGSGGIVNLNGTGITVVGQLIVNAPGSASVRLRRTSATTISAYVLANKG